MVPGNLPAVFSRNWRCRKAKSCSDCRVEQSAKHFILEVVGQDASSRIFAQALSNPDYRHWNPSLHDAGASALQSAIFLAAQWTPKDSVGLQSANCRCDRLLALNDLSHVFAV